MMNVFVLVLLCVLATAGCSGPVSGGSGEKAPTTTEWKEGYGGDSSALEATRFIEQLCWSVRDLRPEYLSAAFETDRDVAEAVCDLGKPGALFVNGVKQPMVDGEPKDFASFPNQEPKKLDVKLEYWRDHKNDPTLRDLILHEVVLLSKFDDRNFSLSRLLGYALDAREGKFAEPLACDTGMVLSYFAGVKADTALTLAREYGMAKCRRAFETIYQFTRVPTTNTSFRTSTQQGYALGLFMRLTQIRLDSFQGTLYVRAFANAVQVFPTALAPWTESCRDRDRTESDDGCDNLINFMVGATPVEKRAVLGVKNSIVSFDRAAAALLRTLPFDRASILFRGNVNRRLVRAAVRTHGWPQLAAMGELQRLVSDDLTVAPKLMVGIVWGTLRVQGDYWKTSPELDARDLEDYNRCSPANLEAFVETVLNTGRNDLCFDSALGLRRPPVVTTVPLVRPLTPRL